MSRNKNIIRYGKREDLPQRVALKAGSLNLFYEDGFVRYIKLGNQEVIRNINHAVRDYNWGTAPLRIYNEEIEVRSNSFSITYSAEAIQDDISFLWTCKILGAKNSIITFTIEGEALTNFKKNRIGFTVLHPVKECEGNNVIIKKANGDVENKQFPKLISPHQPFVDIQSMEWNIGERKALLEFTGDVFETEDQRNWTDASYKTYCTPLSLPFPVEIKKGDKISQTIKLTVEDKSETTDAQTTGLSFRLNKKPVSLPKINIGQSSEVEPLSTSEIELIKAIDYDCYQVDIKLFETSWKEQLKRAFQESKLLGFSLELSLFFDNVEKELNDFLSVVKTEDTDISIINIFNKKPHVTQKSTLDIVLPSLRKAFSKASIGAGTNAFFTELNRERVLASALDFLVYSINPQVHAFDNDSLVETIDAQPYTVRSAENFSEGKSIHISPITFKMRWNPNATGETITVPGELPNDVDVRQISLFGASWTLGSINSLLNTNLASVTFFETVGMKGIMQSAKPQFTDKFFAPASTVFPVYFIFKIIMEHKDWSFYPIQSSDKMVFTGLAFGKNAEGASLVLLANYTENSITITIPTDISGNKATFINDENILQILKNPSDFNELKKENFTENISIPPFGFAFIS